MLSCDLNQANPRQSWDSGSGKGQPRLVGGKARVARVNLVGSLGKGEASAGESSAEKWRQTGRDDTV